MSNKRKEDRAQYRKKVEENLPEKLDFPIFIKRHSLRYGINPGSPAAFYAEKGASGPTMANFDVLQEGRGLGYINLGDMDLGLAVVKSLHDSRWGQAAYCIVKHEMPSGVGLAKNTGVAFDYAWGSDPLSSFGGVHVTSGIVYEYVARELVDKAKNVEVIFAPSFSNGALDILKQRQDLRVVGINNFDEAVVDNGLDYKRVSGGMLVQPRWQTRIELPSDLECVSDRQPTSEEVQAALLQWRVAGFTRSNAVVIGNHYRVHGIGSGQRSRIDAARMAIDLANGRGGTNSCFGAEETFMASDAYMPATDVVEAAHKAGVTGIVFPLGSIKDADVLAAANSHGMTMLATRSPGQKDSERCFTHR